MPGHTRFSPQISSKQTPLTLTFDENFYGEETGEIANCVRKLPDSSLRDIVPRPPSNRNSQGEGESFLQFYDRQDEETRILRRFMLGYIKRRFIDT